MKTKPCTICFVFSPFKSLMNDAIYPVRSIDGKKKLGNFKV
jgi:hypothetical protein